MFVLMKKENVETPHPHEKKRKFGTQWRAALSNDKPPRPKASGCPQVRFGAKLQQIGRTVWCRPFGIDSSSPPHTPTPPQGEPPWPHPSEF